MNVSQLHERVRLELLRRIERGALNVTLLARRTGLAQSTISNFARSKRVLSYKTLDRVLAALGLGVEELAPSPAALSLPPFLVPLVSDEAAMYHERIAEASVIEQIHLSTLVHKSIHAMPAVRGLRSDRFVAVHITEGQAAAVRPLLHSPGIAVLDRHAGLAAVRGRGSSSLHAVRLRGRLHFFHVAYEHGVLLLRPHAAEQPAVMVRLDPPETPEEYLVGRVCAHLAPW